MALLLIAEIVLWGAGPHFWELIAGVQLFFLAFNLMEALLPSLISKESPAGYKGTAMGIYSTSQFLGVAIGGSLGGWVDGCLIHKPYFSRCATGDGLAAGRQHHERAALREQPAGRNSG